MIMPAYARNMARYNRWQNANLIAAANGLSDGERRQDRGAFFGSIFETLNHLLWADALWLHRFSGAPLPVAATPADSRHITADWETYRELRAERDMAILAWAETVTPADLTAEISYFSTTARRKIAQPMGFLVVHMFNHQTHHRGQVHAMLTAAGAPPGDTDLPFLPLGPVAEW
ncbi:MAG: DinB family protein [Alphaproteobacteria bacterium]|nr:DinB family protein [Alphaproteobacteria bacterium]